MCKHRSLSTPPLLGACAASLCQESCDPGQLPWENTWSLRLVQHHAGLCRRRLSLHSICLPPPSLSEPEPPISCSFNPLLSGQRTDARGRPTCRGRAKSKAEAQELCEQRREREISLCRLRSSRLNLHNQLHVPCICGKPE